MSSSRPSQSAKSMQRRSEGAKVLECQGATVPCRVPRCWVPRCWVLGCWVLGCFLAVVAQVFRPAVAVAQTPVAIESVTFQGALDRAFANNPSAAVAAAGIL